MSRIFCDKHNKEIINFSKTNRKFLCSECPDDGQVEECTSLIINQHSMELYAYI